MKAELHTLQSHKEKSAFIPAGFGPEMAAPECQPYALPHTLHSISKIFIQNIFEFLCLLQGRKELIFDQHLLWVSTC